MDKVIVYPGAVPSDTDVLAQARATEYALGRIMQAAFGTPTLIDGLSVTQQTSPNMTVQVAPGCIITQTAVDTAGVAYGSLPVDSSNLVKIGINNSPTTMSALTAPAVAGQSQNWLVQAQFLEADGSPSVLWYYNAANPNIPFAGPTNNGTSQNTRRTNTVALRWKGGVAATTGTQATPSPDAGWTGVSVVTVSNGQSSITNANIVPYVVTPRIGTTLPNIRTQLTADLTLYVATTGSDSNSGLASWHAFATLQKAWDTIITRYDLAGYRVTISVANGTYAGLVTSSMPIGANSGAASVTIVGNVGSPGSVILTSSAAGATVNLNNLTLLTITGVTIQSTGSAGTTGILSNFGSTITIGASVVFGSCVGPHMWAGGGSVVNVVADYTINGGATIHWYGANGTINCSGRTITLIGTPNFSVAFASATLCGGMTVASNTFVGSATGIRYSVSQNGVIGTSGAGGNYLPGSIAGGFATGGEYA